MRTFDELRQYLAAALRRIELQAVHLRRSVAKVEAGGLTDALERLDQLETLTARFARLQHLLIGPFRTVAILELEDQLADRVPDLLNLIEKRGIIESAGDWEEMRELRNAIAHEYWDKEQERDELFGRVVVYSRALLRVLERLGAYVRDHRLL
ncbi:MAG: hypothetical protein ACREXX_00880 [Gammaproteobacteria bacterium]